MRQARLDAARQHVEIAHGIIAWAQAQETNGAQTREQAQQMALRALAKLRYDKNEYFWVNDMQPRVLMHPIKPELDGRDVSGLKDPNGLALFKAFVDQVRQNGRGFVAYQWSKPGNDQPVDKVSYVMGFDAWGWVVGTGVYIDDVRQAALQRAAWTAGVVVAALMLGSYLFYCFYRVMDGGLRETRRHLRAMTEGDLTTTPAPWGRDVVRTMEGLQASSAQISDIVGTIDRIAQQTSILAQRSTLAAREIKHLIGHSVEQVETGTTTVRRAGTTIEEIVTSSQHIDRLLGDIARFRVPADPSPRQRASTQRLCPSALA